MLNIPHLDGFTQTKRPNILFCIADDASYPFMSAYGCTWVKTPAFDYVAKNGILFNNAYTPNAKCAPSRASIITGRNSWQLDAAANHWAYFPATYKSFVETLQENGYYAGFTGKGWAPGIVEKANGKDRQLTGKPFRELKTNVPSSGISSEDYAGNFGVFLSSKPKDQPFCFWYGGWEPHRGYEYGVGIKKGGLKTNSITEVPAFWPDNDSVRTDMLDYAFELQYFDEHLMKIINALKKSGELENTIIVVTADNGMPFPRVKGQEYEYSSHMPLAIMWNKGIKKPGRIAHDFVSFIDFAPTFLEAAGISKTGMQMQGKSLSKIFKSRENGLIDAERNFVLIGKERHDIGRPNDWGYPIRGIVTKDFLYLHNFKPNRWPAGNPETGYLNVDGSPTKTVAIQAGRNAETVRYWRWSFGKRNSEELYGLQSDRNCLFNLSSNLIYDAIRDSLKQKLFQELKKQKDPRMFGKGDIFDEYPYADKNGTHFYERYTKGDTTLKFGWVNKSDFDTLYPKISEQHGH